MIINIINNYNGMNEIYENNFKDAVEQFKQKPNKQNRDLIIKAHNEFKELDKKFIKEIKDIYFGAKTE